MSLQTQSQRLEYSRDFLLKYQHVKSVDVFAESMVAVKMTLPPVPKRKLPTTERSSTPTQQTKKRGPKGAPASTNPSDGELAPATAFPNKDTVSTANVPLEPQREHKQEPRVAATSDSARVSTIDSQLVEEEGEGEENSVSGGSPTKRSTRSPKVVDEHQLEQRQKQIDYGCQTLGYLRYRIVVPKDKRSRDDPRTPKKTQACSKRSWDGQIKKWRRDLHKWDPEDPAAFITWLESEFVQAMIATNVDPELVDLIQKVKERAAKFENSPPPSPSPPRAKKVVATTLYWAERK